MRNILAVEVPLKREGPKSHMRPLSTGLQTQEEESAQHLAMKISGGSVKVRQRAGGVEGWRHMYLLESHISAYRA